MQKPVQQLPNVKYGYSTTCEQLLTLADGSYFQLPNRNILITGGNTGIGKEAAKHLAKTNAAVYIGCRDEKRGKEAEKEIREFSGNVNVHYMSLDLASFDSVRQFASEFKKLNIPIHVLINNAGVMATPYWKTKDGFEYQFGINHLGHFLLTNLLIEELKKGSPSKVICVSSRGHALAPKGIFDATDINMEKSYGSWGAYGRSKAANILFANELHRRYQSEGISAYSLHPGVIKTELARDMWGSTIWNWISGPFCKSLSQGAATTVFLATRDGLASGKYYMDCGVSEPSKDAQDADIAKRLWDLSEKLTSSK